MLKRKKKATPKAKILNGDCVNHSRTLICYGYTHDQDGELIICEEEAEIVRLIYEMAASGASLSRISEHLEDIGVSSLKSKEIWSKETLRRILHNEKYKGHVTLQKTLVENYLEYKQIKNERQLGVYQMSNNHAAIISDGSL